MGVSVTTLTSPLTPPFPAHMTSCDVHGEVFPTCLKDAMGRPARTPAVHECSAKAKFYEVNISGWVNSSESLFWEDIATAFSTPSLERKGLSWRLTASSCPIDLTVPTLASSSDSFQAFCPDWLNSPDHVIKTAWWWGGGVGGGGGGGGGRMTC